MRRLSESGGEKMKVLKCIFGMFIGKDGILSSTKILSLSGYLAFLVVSALVLYTVPEKFNYELFAILTAGSGTGLRIFDKYLNLKVDGLK